MSTEETAKKLRDAAMEATLDALIKPHVPAPVPTGGNPFDDLRAFAAAVDRSRYRADDPPIRAVSESPEEAE